LDEATHFYEDVLGIKVVDTEEVEEQKVITAFLPLGDSEIELLAPTAP
jgi:methylmalonyl-CoA/ethylmalonyl-CoA epimerase